MRTFVHTCIHCCPVCTVCREGHQAEGLLRLPLHSGQPRQQQCTARWLACAGHPLPQHSLQVYALPHPRPHPLLCSVWRTPTRQPQGLPVEGRRRGMRSWLRPRHTSGGCGVSTCLELLAVECCCSRRCCSRRCCCCRCWLSPVSLLCTAAACKGHATMLPPPFTPPFDNHNPQEAACLPGAPHAAPHEGGVPGRPDASQGAPGAFAALYSYGGLSAACCGGLAWPMLGWQTAGACIAVQHAASTPSSCTVPCHCWPQITRRVACTMPPLQVREWGACQSLSCLLVQHILSQVRFCLLCQQAAAAPAAPAAHQQRGSTLAASLLPMHTCCAPTSVPSFYPCFHCSSRCTTRSWPRSGTRSMPWVGVGSGPKIMGGYMDSSANGAVCGCRSATAAQRARVASVPTTAAAESSPQCATGWSGSR